MTSRSRLSPLLLEAVTHIFQKEIKPTISGPSNIGNLLASKDIAALSGFGVSYANIHAADEKIELATILPVYEVYREVINRIMTVKKPQAVSKVNFLEYVVESFDVHFFFIGLKKIKLRREEKLIVFENKQISARNF